ncbi:hypothetical protein AgCh_014816 [Apium graveolens]
MPKSKTGVDLMNCSSDNSLYEEGEKVWASYSDKWYEAKVLTVVESSMTAKRYLVHYPGWNKRWDEWLGTDRLMKFTDENIQIQLAKNTKSGHKGKAKQSNEDIQNQLARNTKSGDKGKAKQSDERLSSKPSNNGMKPLSEEFQWVPRIEVAARDRCSQGCGSSRRKRLPLLLFLFLSSLKSIFISSIHWNCQQRLRSGSRNDTFSVQGIGSTLMAPGQIVKQLQGIIHLDKIMYEMLRSYCHTKRPNDSTEMVSLACSSLSGMASSTDVNIDHGIPLSEELQWINELNLPKHQYEWYLDLRRHGTVKNSGFSFVFDLLVLYATGLNDVRDVVPFPRSFAKANY